MITFRAISDLDRPLIQKSIDLEPYHRDWLLADYFYDPETMTILGSENMIPILFLRMKPVGRTVYLFAQFVSHNPLRNARAMCKGFPIIKATLEHSGFGYVVIDSISPPVVQLCQRRLGFSPLVTPDHYSLRIGSA